MKLWKKGDHQLDKDIEKFTVGRDYLLDQRLIPFDVVSSKAHVSMLVQIGVLSRDEGQQLKKGLDDIAQLAESGSFTVSPEDEDCHTAIENYLTQHYGEIGKKIHTYRSRNDQVLTALRLYEKHELATIATGLNHFIHHLENFVTKYGSVGIPGFTHMRKAMPTTVGIWAECFVASAQDNLQLVEAVQQLVDQSPLGTAAGYGVPSPQMDRELTASEMGFRRVLQNPIYAQMSRSKFEATMIHACSQILFDFNKLSNDLILFSMPEFGYFSLPESFTTGSSIMPQKKNPDILEILRGRYHLVVAEEIKLRSMTANLISGYHRDLQLTKEPLMLAIDHTKECIHMATQLIQGLVVDSERCKAALTEELYATAEVYKLVDQGVPFREAYRQIGQRYQGEIP